MRRRKQQLWHADVHARLRFERGARERYPSLTVTSTGRGRGARVIYRVVVEVPEFGARRVTICLSNGYEPYCEQITADGPTESPHRYSERQLCVWRPTDPPENRWQAEDGLLELINHVLIHLFKEAYWRETGEWLGEEAPHPPIKQPSGEQKAA